MIRPSKTGEVVVAAFGLIFAGAGVLLGGTLLFGTPGREQGGVWVGVAISVIFILIGCGIAYGSFYGTRQLEQQYEAAQANPQAPWLWRKDWANRRSESRNRNKPIGLGVAAICANALVFAVAFSVIPNLWRTSNLLVLLPLGFCVLGIILAVVAIRAGIRRGRFGETYFEFGSLPFCPGQSLRGTIHLRLDSNPEHGFDVSLRCLRRVVTGTGDNRSTQESVLWQTDQNVAQGIVTSGPMGDATIPIDISIPSDAYESYHEQSDDQVFWILHARADVPGISYSDDFEVPVFRTAPAPISSGISTASFSGQAGAAAARAFEFDPSDVPAPQSPRVVVSTGMNGGTEFYFPPFRNPGRFLVTFLFAVLWTALLYLIRNSHAPWVFTAVFGVFDILIIYAVIRAAVGTVRVEVGNGKIAFRRALLGVGSGREVAFTDISKILTATTAQQAGAKSDYSILLYTNDDRKMTLADSIADREEARWVVAQIEKLAGLKLDTHVAVQGGFGLQGPPPQRGQFSSVAAGNIRSKSPAAIAAGLAFFLAWTGFVGYHFLNVRNQQAKRTPRSTTRTRARASSRPAVYGPLTDADVQRLETLPDQEQAEELLGRAIQHDPQALELFEQKIGGWRNLQRTAQMNDLERRSSYSTDLRVRYANADLNLAIDGLAKVDSTADQLITQAEADAEHRPYSVYHMGMLAGRGVGYARIYPVLVGYARNDPDAQVRQWAVEGLRYVGTDEALEALYYSFTHDSSNAVRDRAGCNVSDCGNFMRKQRMQFVPRLIKLADDAQTSPQMRNWSFLALREITDENLPADATAWQNWYTQHGTEKMAEFERLDWWVVRGDQ